VSAGRADVIHHPADAVLHHHAQRRAGKRADLPGAHPALRERAGFGRPSPYPITLPDKSALANALGCCCSRHAHQPACSQAAGVPKGAATCEPSACDRVDVLPPARPGRLGAHSSSTTEQAGVLSEDWHVASDRLLVDCEILGICRTGAPQVPYRGPYASAADQCALCMAALQDCPQVLAER